MKKVIWMGAGTYNFYIRDHIADIVASQIFQDNDYKEDSYSHIQNKQRRNKREGWKK